MIIMEPKGMGYSLDLRKKVINYVNKGHSREDASKIFGVGVRTIYRWIARFKAGSLAETKAHKPWKKLDPQALAKAVEKNPGYKLSDFAKLFKVTTAAICLAFKTLGITRKKRQPSTENEMKQSDRYFWHISRSTKQKI